MIKNRTARVRRNSMKTILLTIKGETGVTAVLVAIMIVMLLGFAALAIDIGHLYVVRNELQNAADAGALAGAAKLYIDGATEINTGANLEGYNAAKANKSEKTSVDVNWTGGNEGDVQRGHWCFSSKTFTPNASTTLADLWNASTEELDANTDFINAVRVRTRREATPASSFFARIFGFNSFNVSAEAVAYTGFIADQPPLTADEPIAICKQSLGDPYTCTVGRMISDTGGGIENGNWTDLVECVPAEPYIQGAPDDNEIMAAVGRGCGGTGANVNTITFGTGLRVSDGMIQEKGLTPLRNCWWAATAGTRSWLLRLPVIDCVEPFKPCRKVVGAVDVRVLWITEQGDGQVTAPSSMTGWGEGADAVSSWSATGTKEERWNSFRDHFGLKNLDGTPAPLLKKTLYFLPDCTPHIPDGSTGGENFGISAKIPVLVK
jgi:Flp pilus assembly protein TadG